MVGRGGHTASTVASDIGNYGLLVVVGKQSMVSKFSRGLPVAHTAPDTWFLGGNASFEVSQQ